MSLPIIDELNAAARAMVVLSVPWSIYAVKATANFAEAISRLEAYGILTTSLDEDDVDNRRFANSHLSRVPVEHPIGAGSIIWLEFGNEVDSELGGASLTPDEIVPRTKRLWQQMNES